MTNWDAVNTVCPFYKTEDDKSISCEGIINNKCTRHIFTKSSSKKQHKNDYCNSVDNYQKCRYFFNVTALKYSE